MSKITKVVVENCQSIEHAVIEFDKRGIINLKGYNDSGKTAILTCLAVALYNRYKSKQVKFITDDKEYMRCVIYFDDGVAIVRDKYRSGASLYEMYRGNEVIFSTKEGNVLQNFEEVPEPIAAYLGVVEVDGITLNYRTEKDALLLTDTKGGENYKFLHGTLHADELVLAAKLLNADKNVTKNQLDMKVNQLTVLKNEYNSLYGLNQAMVDAVNKLDDDLSAQEEKLALLEDILQKKQELDNIAELPTLETISYDKLNILGNILSELDTLNEEVTPTLELIDTTKMTLLSNLITSRNTLDSIKVIPTVDMIDNSKLNSIKGIWESVKKLVSAEEKCSELNNQIEVEKSQLEDIEKELEAQNVKAVRCQNCGTLSLVSKD